MLGELVQRGSCWYKLCPTLRCCFIVVCACDFLVFKLFSNGQVRLKKKKTNNELFHLYIIVTSSFPTTSVVFKNTNRKDLRRLSLYVKAREKIVCGRSEVDWEQWQTGNLVNASEYHVNSPGLYRQPENIDTIRFPLSWVLCVCF